MPSGGLVTEYEVRIQVDERHTETVPAVWHDAPAAAASFAAGTEITVVGRVRRRFFRSGGATQSRTEVVVRSMSATRSKRRVAVAVDGAMEELQGLVRV